MMRRRLMLAGGQMLLLLALSINARGQSTLESLKAQIRRDTAVDQIALDGCVRVHHVWKRQVIAASDTSGSPSERAERFATLSFRPFASFWKGYAGDESTYASLAQRLNLAADPRASVPAQVDVGALIIDAVGREIAASGNRPCPDWYVVFGPGFANLGGLSGGEMLIDFMGLARTDPVEDIRLTLPHELNHISFGAGHKTDADARTLLAAIIMEGFGSWYADLFWGEKVSPAKALGYTDAEWEWALAHERELWSAADTLLASRERAVLDRFRSARTRIDPSGPPKVGYFLGYRIVDAYVRKHGKNSWHALFQLPIARILAESGYSPGR